MRNPAWKRDELILALDLYFRIDIKDIKANHPEVIRLSKILNKLPIHTKRPDAKRFRNPNGVSMKLRNFARFDSNFQGKTLEKGGKLEIKIWNEFVDKPDYLHEIANKIINSMDYISDKHEEDYQEEEFLEGKILYRQHRII